ncbi:MAG: hypothetical protein N0C84_01065 [Candidatus Thiodiazotropha taylori]|uniref:Uncharacterized protein n=1 Tax=Candidatus Thiodiazotropha taylori TaxID=2792791 RepID=A0A9E4N239_9GAMM|nr:hypothetical protein [Candidatus Thiodiazotropha taylori]MCW4255036.1 hypothetical protein [Candidatus Thiodiazotropha taylori]
MLSFRKFLQEKVRNQKQKNSLAKKYMQYLAHRKIKIKFYDGMDSKGKPIIWKGTYNERLSYLRKNNWNDDPFDNYDIKKQAIYGAKELMTTTKFPKVWKKNKINLEEIARTCLKEKLKLLHKLEDEMMKWEKEQESLRRELGDEEYYRRIGF